MKLKLIAEAKEHEARRRQEEEEKRNAAVRKSVSRKRKNAWLVWLKKMPKGRDYPRY